MYYIKKCFLPLLLIIGLLTSSFIVNACTCRYYPRNAQEWIYYYQYSKFHQILVENIDIIERGSGMMIGFDVKILHSYSGNTSAYVNYRIQPRS